MHKIVLDSNTIISGFLWDGNEAVLIRKIEQGKASNFINQDIIDEIDEVLRRDKFRELLKSADITVDEIMSKIVNISTLVIGSRLKENVVKDDPEDDKFIECALHAKAKYIVSGDNHLLKLKRYKNIEIKRTSDILSVL